MGLLYVGFKFSDPIGTYTAECGVLTPPLIWITVTFISYTTGVLNMDNGLPANYHLQTNRNKMSNYEWFRKGCHWTVYRFSHSKSLLCHKNLYTYGIKTKILEFITQNKTVSLCSYWGIESGWHQHCKPVCSSYLMSITISNLVPSTNTIFCMEPCENHWDYKAYPMYYRTTLLLLISAAEWKYQWILNVYRCL
jgi:hypothetical protein